MNRIESRNKFRWGLNLLLNSILAGVVIGIACVVNLSCDNKYIGAVLFSFALIVIIEYGLQLYTGKIKSFKAINQIPNFIIMLIGNFIGSQIVLLFNVDTSSVVASKLSMSPSSTFFAAIGCGILMAIATMGKDKLITILCVVIFILSGYQHIIANMGYLAGNYSLEMLVFLLINLAGNTLGSIAFYHIYCYLNIKK